MGCGTSQGGSVTEAYRLLPPDNGRETMWELPASKSPGRRELPPPTTSALESLSSGKAMSPVDRETFTLPAAVSVVLDKDRLLSNEMMHSTALVCAQYSASNPLSFFLGSLF